MDVLPRSGEWSVAELELLPDDGLRYELVDGVLLVSRLAQTLEHQRCAGRLLLVIDNLVLPGQERLPGPIVFQPTDRRSLMPDLVIITTDDPGETALTLPLVLAVEIVSPSSRSIDQVLKRELYEQSGVLHYWVADPATRTVTVWDLVDGRYGEARIVRDGHPVTLAAPVVLTISTEAVFGPA